MYSTNFYIVKTNGQEIIRDHKSGLQIKIYPLNEVAFVPNHNEITLYSNNTGAHLAFETVNSKGFDVKLIAYALSWYVDYTEQFNLVIGLEDLQHQYKLKRA